MEIRRLEVDDFEKWFEMRLASLRECPSAYLSSPESEDIQFLREKVATGGEENLIFTCIKNKSIIGSVGLYRESALKARHKGTIWGMYVKPEYRGQKVGRKLMEAALHFAHSEMKLSKVDLSVMTTQETAKHLYLSLGFEKWGLERHAICVEGEFFDEEYMSYFFS